MDIWENDQIKYVQMCNYNMALSNINESCIIMAIVNQKIETKEN